MRRLSVVVALLALGSAACAGGAADSSASREMTFMAGFAPQANLPFVGVYVAEEQGYFADEGLEVTIQHSAGGGEHLQLLTAGEVDVTTQDAAVLLQRRADPGLPLVSIGLIGQRGQQAFVALTDRGIESPEDWEGRTVGYKGTPPPDVFAILDAVGLEASDVQLVNVGFDPRVLTEGQVDVYPVFKSNEPDTLRKWGFELEMWDAADYGAPTLGLTYVATEEAIEEDSEKFSAFMRAVIRGIDYARDDPEGATDIVMEYVGEDGDRDHQLFMLQTELQEATTDQTEEHGFGWQTAEQWQALHDFLLQYDALATSVDVSKVFTDELLP